MLFHSIVRDTHSVEKTNGRHEHNGHRWREETISMVYEEEVRLLNNQLMHFGHLRKFKVT